MSVGMLYLYYQEYNDSTSQGGKACMKVQIATLAIKRFVTNLYSDIFN